MNDEKCDAHGITSEQLVSNFCRFLPKRTEEKKEVHEERVFNSFITVIPEDNDIVSEYCKYNEETPPKKGIDTDIFSIDRRIKEEFNTAKESIPDMERRRKRLEWIKNNAVNKIERIKAENEIFNLTKSMVSVVNEENKREYVERTKDILNEITEIMSVPTVRSFISSSQSSTEKDNSKKIRELFQLYFSIASKFTCIDPGILPSNSNDSRYVCEDCDNDVFDISEEGKRECSECGKIVDVLEMHLTYKDTERINLIPRYNYSKDGHFRSAIDKFQGKQNKTIPEEVYRVIYNEIDKYDLYTKETITKPAIYSILSQNGFGDFYEDINLIHSVVSGIPPPDISMYKSSLIDMNAEFEKVYDKIKIKLGKNNALNVNHKLANFLEILGYYANEDDLIGLKTRNKKIEHDDVMKEAFEILGWITMWKT